MSHGGAERDLLHGFVYAAYKTLLLSVVEQLAVTLHAEVILCPIVCRTLILH
jgi:hypothetical protein